MSTCDKPRPFSGAARIAALFVFAIAARGASEPAPTLDWEQLTLPAGSAGGRGVWTAFDELGRVYTVGLRRESPPSFENHIVVLRHGVSGLVERELVLDDTDYVEVDAVRLEESGDLLVCALAAGVSPELVTRRLTADGDPVWIQRFPLASPPVAGIPPRLYVRDASIWVAAAYGAQGHLIRYSLDGDLDWEQAVTDTAERTFSPTDLTVGPDGVAYVSGPDYPNPGVLVRTVAFDPGGTYLWDHFEGGDIGSMFGNPQVGMGPDSLVVVAATAESTCGVLQMRTWKLDRNGDVMWEDSFPAAPCESADVRALAVDVEGRVAVAGWYASPAEIDYHVILYTPEGSRSWMQSFDGPGAEDVPSGVAFDDAGAVYVVGTTNHPPQNRDVLLVKWDRDGDLAWWVDWAGPGDGNDFGNALALAPGGEIAVAGEPPIVTLRYSQEVPVQVPAGLSTPGGAALRPVSVNPFRSVLDVRYELVTDGEIRVQVFDVNGARVRTLVSGSVVAGVHETTWDGAAESGAPAAPGVYFIRLETGLRHDTVRVALVR